ncbi:MAG: hypothetical protein K2P81_06455 [Bacteriovoracaceae bacterium]|nr:hypothetical protein [Bacteriovoracaceae bacterium]
MKLVVSILLFSLSSSLFANDEQLKKLELMVKSGVITQEAAGDEYQRMMDPRKHSITARGEAQRDLASVSPSLKPLKIKRVQLSPLILYID